MAHMHLAGRKRQAIVWDPSSSAPSVKAESEAKVQAGKPVATGKVKAEERPESSKPKAEDRSRSSRWVRTRVTYTL